MDSKTQKIVIGLLAVVVVALIYIGIVLTPHHDRALEYGMDADSSGPGGQMQVKDSASAPDYQPNTSMPPIPHNDLTKIAWLKSPIFGIYYDPAFTPMEFYTNAAGANTPQKDGGIPYAQMTFTNNHDTVITWGGYNGTKPATCTATTFGTFQYGYSTIGCVNGYRTIIEFSNSRTNVPAESLKTFGDFVLKNK